VASQAGPAEAPDAADPPAKGPGAPAFDFSSTEQVKTYPVRAARVQELVDAASGSDLKDVLDGPGGAQTASTLSFDYKSAPRGRGCAISSARVRVAVTQTSPKRADAAGSAPDLDARWRELERVMRVHEDGHKKISIQIGREFLRRLQALGAFPSCADVDAAVQTLYKRQESDSRQQNVDYDVETGRGRKQWDAAYASSGRDKP
jgi:predicted secreted Zn-dependent protease